MRMIELCLLRLGIVLGKAIGLLCGDCPEWVSCRTYRYCIRNENDNIINRINLDTHLWSRCPVRLGDSTFEFPIIKTTKL